MFVLVIGCFSRAETVDRIFKIELKCVITSAGIRSTGLDQY